MNHHLPWQAQTPASITSPCTGAWQPYGSCWGWRGWQWSSAWDPCFCTDAPGSGSSSEAWTSRMEQPLTLTPDHRKAPSLRETQGSCPPQTHDSPCPSSSFSTHSRPRGRGQQLFREKRRQCAHKATGGRQKPRPAWMAMCRLASELFPPASQKGPRKVKPNTDHGGQITTATFTYWQKPSGCKRRWT